LSSFLSPFYIQLLEFVHCGDMTQIDSIPPSLTSSTTSLSGPKAARRFVVLVPDLEWSFIPTIHRIWDLANSQHARVLLISLCKDPKQAPSLRRALIILCAMVQDGRIPVETNVEIGTNWVDVIRRHYQVSDMIVCFAEQRAGLLQKPLSQILESNLGIPVYVVSGMHMSKPKSNWLADVTAWLGSLGIIAGFGLLQIKIVQAANGWFQTLLLVLVSISEIGLIWVWDSRFR
jgi:hypothetical protein